MPDTPVPAAAVAAHTPAPWAVDHAGAQWGVVGATFATGGRRRRVARCGSPKSYFDPDVDAEDRANARLIASAPDLLNACERARVALEDWLNDYAADFCDEERVKEARARIHEHGGIAYIGDAIGAVRTALAKATGSLS